MAEDKAKWMSIGEAAEFLGVSRDTLRRWEKKGKIQPVRSPTNRRYYTEKHLEEVMAGRFEHQTGEKNKSSLKKGDTSKIAQEPNTSKLKSKKGLKIFLIGLVSFLIAAAIGAVVFFFVL